VVVVAAEAATEAGAAAGADAPGTVSVGEKWLDGSRRAPLGNTRGVAAAGALPAIIRATPGVPV
jgi:hypothetical protein